MEEYNTKLASRLIPDSEIDYYKALTNSYTRIVAELAVIEAKLAQGKETYLGTKWEWTKARQTNMLKLIEKEIRSLNLDYRKQFKDELPEIVLFDNIATVEEYNYTLLSNGTAVSLNHLNKAQIRSVIKTDQIIFLYKTRTGTHKTTLSISSMLQSPAENAIKDIRGIINANVILGNSPTQIAREIQKSYITTQKQHVRTVTKTLIMQGTQDAQSAFYKANTEYTSHYHYLATLDTRTTTICRDLDGRNFNEFPPLNYQPPLHPNCRSRLISIPKGYQPNERPLNLMTAVEKRKARGIKDPHEREEYLKQYIMTVPANMKYRELEKLYPKLKNSEFINKGTYTKELGISK